MIHTALKGAGLSHLHHCMPPSSNTSNSSSVQEADSNLRGQIMKTIGSMDWFLSLHRKPGLFGPKFIEHGPASTLPEANGVNRSASACQGNDQVSGGCDWRSSQLPAIKVGWVHMYPQFEKRTSRSLLFYTFLSV